MDGQQFQIVNSSDSGLDYDFSLLDSLVPIKSLLEGHRQTLAQQSNHTVVFAGEKLCTDITGDDIFYLLSGDIRLDATDNVSTEVIKGRSCSMPINYLPHSLPANRYVAVTDCSILRVNRLVLDKFLTWSHVAEYLMLDIAYRPELEDDQQWTSTVLKSNLFYKVPPLNVPDMFTALTSKIVDADQVIVRQGEVGDSCFFIKEGTAKVVRMSEDSRRGEHLADIGVGRCFGEDALLNATTRNATVTMTSHGVLMELKKDDFLQLLKEPHVKAIDNLEDAKKTDAILLDIRTSEEYSAGHLDQAANIPLNLLKLKQRLLDKSIDVITYCDSGRRSRAAAELLNRQGFNACYLSSGLQGVNPQDLQSQWSQEDFVLVGGRPQLGQ